jgi:hypothetical protein
MADEEAAVGSISHILATAFKDVYEESSKREQAAAARLELEARRAAEAENPEKDEGEPSPDSEPNLEEGDEPSSPKRTEPEVDPLEELASYVHPFEKLSLNEKNTALLTEKKSAVSVALNAMMEDAAKLKAYLRTQKDEARILEVEEEDSLKKQGVFLGQHIPSLPTQLKIDPDEINMYGAFSRNLMVANDLVETNKVESLRRTGNLPISELAEQKKAERNKNKATLDTKIPHYQQITSVSHHRSEGTKEHFAESMRAQSMMKEIAAASGKLREPLPRKRYPPRDRNDLTAVQKAENESILKGIQHKLNYLRNPRSDPKAVSRTLIKPGATGAITGPAETRKAGTKSSSAPASVSDSGKATESGAQQPKPLFQPSPSHVHFSGYHVGRKYTRNISFRNISSLSRSLRVVPPASAHFTMDALRYPANSRAGLVAPGMSVSTVLRFLPDSLGNFSDSIVVETESGSVSVLVTAEREPPCLSLPSVLDVGACLVGDAIRTVFRCYNSGGAGSFRLVSDEVYCPERDGPTGADAARVTSHLDFAQMGCIRSENSAFTIYPVCFDLGRGESVDLIVEFVPLCISSFTTRFHMLWDNDEVSSFDVRCFSKQLDVDVTEINRVALLGCADANMDIASSSSSDSSSSGSGGGGGGGGDSSKYAPTGSSSATLVKDIYFGPTVIGAEMTQEVVVSNCTGMPLPFEWVWVPASTPAVDTRRVARAKYQQSSQAYYDMLGTPGQSPICTPDETQQQQRTHENGLGATSPSSPSGAEAKGEENLESDLRPDPELQRQLLEEHGMPSDTMRAYNEATEGSYSISPRFGTLGVDGASEFRVIFRPLEVDLPGTKYKAVLLLKGVPLSANPDGAQVAFLTRLAEKGHGSHLRLRSWLGEFSVQAQLPPYEIANGDTVDKGKIVSLDTIFRLVSRFTMPTIATKEAQEDEEPAVEAEADDGEEEEDDRSVPIDPLSRRAAVTRKRLREQAELDIVERSRALAGGAGGSEGRVELPAQELLRVGQWIHMYVPAVFCCIAHVHTCLCYHTSAGFVLSN